MIKKLLKVFIILLAIASKGNAQTCLHSDLSKKFDYKIIRTDQKDFGGTASKIIIEIYNKGNKKLFQRLQFTSTGYGLSNTFRVCTNEKSFVTGQNLKGDISDEDYGDIVVADLNFDGKEDFAVKHNIPADTGPQYWYFIQGKKGFKKDEYLSKRMPFFPWLIKSQKHQLISMVSPHAGTHIYQFQYNTTSKKWKKIGERFVYHDEGLDKILARLKNN